MSGRPAILYLVCYDICGDGAPSRLRKVYTTLRGFGDHLQYSVFRCRLTPMQLEELCGTLEDIIAPRQDQVMFVPLGAADSRTSWRTFTLGIPIDSPPRTVRIV